MKKQEENIAAIAERIRGLRDIVGISAAEMAKHWISLSKNIWNMKKGKRIFPLVFFIRWQMNWALTLPT